MDFPEAERRFNKLKRQHEAGSISADEFDAGRERLKVKDRGGRWWVQGREGDWYYYDGSRWVLWVPVGPTPNQQPPAGLGWIIGGAVCAFLSLLFLPILLGPLGIFLGYMALRADNRTAGIAVMAAAGTCMIVGFILSAVFISTL